MLRRWFSHSVLADFVADIQARPSRMQEQLATNCQALEAVKRCLMPVGWRAQHHQVVVVLRRLHPQPLKTNLATAKCQEDGSLHSVLADFVADLHARRSRIQERLATNCQALGTVKRCLMPVGWRAQPHQVHHPLAEHGDSASPSRLAENVPCSNELKEPIGSPSSQINRSRRIDDK